MRAARRLLVVLSSLVLLLPAGWCCAVPVPAARASAPAACPCCQKTCPAPERPAPPVSCDCVDKASLVPTAPQKELPAVARLSVSPGSLPVSPHEVRTRGPADWFCPLPIHIRLQVWLC